MTGPAETVFEGEIDTVTTTDISGAPTGVQGITEADIANYLAASPGFFERHAELLGSIQLTSPHGQRAVSLQERQMEMLRDKIKGLERQIIEMIRNGQDNVADRRQAASLDALADADRATPPTCPTCWCAS